MTGSDPKESAQTAFLQEGEKTWGVWLPIALADVLTMLYIVSRRAAGDTKKVNIMKRSEVLKSWMLPAMSAAIAEDEAEAEAWAMLESIRNLKKAK